MPDSLDQTYEGKQHGGLRLVRWAGNRVGHHGYPWLPVGAAVLLALPSLWTGFQADDWALRAAALQAETVPGVIPDRWQPFMLDGDGDVYAHLVDYGWLPWWTDSEMRTKHMRFIPLFTHAIDFTCWPEWPFAMHLHSLLWLAMATFFACLFFKDVLGTRYAPWVCGAVALMFALDDSHAMPASWLANRNTLVAAVFGIGSLIVYHRCRTGKYRRAAWAPPVLLLLALLSKEEAVSFIAYLFAYACFVDSGSLRHRAAGLLPCLAVFAGWAWAYAASGFGAAHTGVYVDPLHNPAAFAYEVIAKMPLYLLAQFALPPSDLAGAWTTGMYRAHWILACVSLVIILAGLLPLLRHDRIARFWLSGALLSVIPLCAIFPSDRLLFLVGFGIHPVLVLWLHRLSVADGLIRRGVWGRLRSGAAWLVVGIHLVVAPLLLPVSATGMKFVGDMLMQPFRTLPEDDAFGDQIAVFVNTRAAMIDCCWMLERRAKGIVTPERILNLAPAASASMMTRLDSHTILVEPVGGYLKPYRWLPPDRRGQMGASPRFIGQMLDTLTRASSRPLPVGAEIELDYVTVTIDALTSDGRPASARFRFDMPLESDRLRWLRLQDGVYRTFIPPTPGTPVFILGPDESDTPALPEP